jgi:hypothetical protein
MDDDRLELDEDGFVIGPCDVRSTVIDLDVVDRMPLAPDWLHVRPRAAVTGAAVVVLGLALCSGSALGNGARPNVLPTTHATTSTFRDPATGAIVIAYRPPDRGPQPAA